MFLQVVKLWDFETGAPIFEYGEAHDEAAITCMTFDNTARRLITGGRDGILKIWNYNNGHCLRVLKKGQLMSFLTSLADRNRCLHGWSYSLLTCEALKISKKIDWKGTCLFMPS